MITRQGNVESWSLRFYGGGSFRQDSRIQPNAISIWLNSFLSRTEDNSARASRAACLLFENVCDTGYVVKRKMQVFRPKHEGLRVCRCWKSLKMLEKCLNLAAEGMQEPWSLGQMLKETSKCVYWSLQMWKNVVRSILWLQRKLREIALNDVTWVIKAEDKHL